MEDVRDLSIEWHKPKRTAHNPYHPRNGSVAMVIKSNTKFLQWCRVTDVNQWSTRKKKAIEMVLRQNIKGLDVIYSDDIYVYKTTYNYLEESEMSKYKSVTNWIDNSLFKTYDEKSNFNFGSLFNFLGHDPSILVNVQFLVIDSQYKEFKLLHEIELTKADNEYLKSLQEE